jgi:hypothetical protein
MLSINLLYSQIALVFQMLLSSMEWNTDPTLMQVIDKSNQPTNLSKKTQESTGSTPQQEVFTELLSFMLMVSGQLMTPLGLLLNGEVC